jgi:hypothetical protein
MISLLSLRQSSIVKCDISEYKKVRGWQKFNEQSVCLESLVGFFRNLMQRINPSFDGWIFLNLGHSQLMAGLNISLYPVFNLLA